MTDVRSTTSCTDLFSRLTLDQVRITPDGRDTLLVAKMIRVRYSLISILRGDIAVEEIALDTPTLSVVTSPDGSSNLENLKYFLLLFY